MNLLERTPRKIMLYGHLREKFGREYSLAVDTPADAITALCHSVPGFKAHMIQHSLPGYRVITGIEPHTAETLHHPSTGAIKIVPVVSGAEKSNLENVLVGAALIGLAAWNPLAWGVAAQMIGGMGMSLVFGGVAAALSDASGPQSPANQQEHPSYAFSGPVNTVGQGQAIPVVLGGPIRVGGPLISCGVTAEDYKPGGNIGQGAPDDIGTRGGNGHSTPYVYAVKEV